MWPAMSRPSLDPAPGRGVAFRELTERRPARPERSGSSRVGAGSRGLAEPVDPQVGIPSSRRRERRRGSATRATCTSRQPAGPLLERTPVTGRGLVGADLGGDDRELERDADAAIDASMKSRSVFDRIASFQPRRAPARARPAPRGTRASPAAIARALRRRRSRAGADTSLMHLAVAKRGCSRLHLRLELVVAGEQLVADDPRIPAFQSTSVP